MIGSTYAFPARPQEGDKTIAQVKETFVSFQEDVAASSSILCVGGGATGIEFAGEVAAFYGDKKQVTVRNSFLHIE